MKDRLVSESEEQKTLIEWSKYHSICRYCLIAIPNGGTRNPREAKSLKLQGVRAGVCDLFLAYPTSKYAGLWIELKRKEAYHVTETQKEWIERMNNVGYLAVICHGCDEAIKVIEDYLNA